MWGLSSGKMHTVEADFCEHPQVGEVLRRADVILVNNEVYGPPFRFGRALRCVLTSPLSTRAQFPRRHERTTVAHVSRVAQLDSHRVP